MKMKKIDIFKVIELLIIIPILTILICHFGVNYINFIGQNSDISALYFNHYEEKKEKKISEKVTIIRYDSPSREDLVQLIKKIQSFHPKKIGLDFIFQDRKDEKIDSMLINEISKADNIILASDIRDHRYSFFTTNQNKNVGTTNPYSNIYIRDYKLFDKDIPTFGALLAGIRKKERPFFNKFKIDFTTSTDILNSQFLNATEITDRIVLIGDLDNDDDKVQTPIGIKSGVETQAYILNTILKNSEMGLGYWGISAVMLIVIYISYMLIINKLCRSGYRWVQFCYSWIITILVGLMTCALFLIYLQTKAYHIFEYILLFPISLSVCISAYTALVNSIKCKKSFFYINKTQ